MTCHSGKHSKTLSRSPRVSEPPPGFGVRPPLPAPYTDLPTAPEGARIPKGFRRKAQGCAARATLGQPVRGITTLKGVATRCDARREAGRNPVGVVSAEADGPRGNWNKLLRERSAWARSAQPWASRRNPFGIADPYKEQTALPHSKSFAWRGVRELQAPPPTTPRCMAGLNSRLVLLPSCLVSPHSQCLCGSNCFS